MYIHKASLKCMIICINLTNEFEENLSVGTKPQCSKQPQSASPSDFLPAAVYSAPHCPSSAIRPPAAKMSYSIATSCEWSSYGLLYQHKATDDAWVSLSHRGFNSEVSIGVACPHPIIFTISFFVRTTICRIVNFSVIQFRFYSASRDMWPYNYSNKVAKKAWFLPKSGFFLGPSD